MSEARCPNCGAEIPRESGQHALAPAAGVVSCPSCGATVTLERPGNQQESAEGAQVPTASEAPPGRPTGDEYFSGQESVEGVMEELSEKEGGPRD
jgi:hypothetical protein